MSDIEVDKCDFCQKIVQVVRTYLRPSLFIKPSVFEEYKDLYNSGNYFIIIKTCNSCGKPKID
jgi:hypothetical protein